MNDLSKPQQLITSLPVEDARVDHDPLETSEWMEAFESLVRESGTERAQFIYDKLAAFAGKRGVKSERLRNF